MRRYQMLFGDEDLFLHTWQACTLCFGLLALMGFLFAPEPSHPWLVGWAVASAVVIGLVYRGERNELRRRAAASSAAQSPPAD